MQPFQSATPIDVTSKDKLASPVIRMRGSRNFRQGGGGGGGGPGQQSDKKSSDNVFFQVFFSPLAYFTEVKWSISKKSITFQGSIGEHFPGGGGVQLFPGEVQLLIPYRNPYNL